jgi:cytochrome c-type biogenesis protein CcmH/NrfG
MIPAPAAAPPAASTLDTADDEHEIARQARLESKGALERHDLPHALDAAERAVLYDPDDAEGWLLLGAAHIDRGNYGAAQKAFKECVAKAKLGDRQECLWLLH